MKTLEEIVRHVKPSVLIGLAGAGPAFEQVNRQLSSCSCIPTHDCRRMAVHVLLLIQSLELWLGSDLFWVTSRVIPMAYAIHID